MPTSVVGICSSALVKLGASTITSLTEGSKNANACNEQYTKIRDQLLRGHPWNFAIARAKLAQLSATPAIEFDFAYQLPDGWMRTLNVYDNNNGIGSIHYRMEGKKLLASATTVYLRYVQLIKDPNTMDHQFHEALAWALAADIGGAITQSNRVVEQMREGLRIALSDAKGTDAIEDEAEQWPEDEWVTARF